MTAHSITGFHDTSILAATAGDSWMVVKTARVVSRGYGIDVSADDATLDIAGRVVGYTAGVYGNAADWTVKIAATGGVYGGVPSFPAGDAAAMRVEGSNTFTADIDGTVQGYTSGIYSTATANTITLGKKGAILTSYNGIDASNGTSFKADIDGRVVSGYIGINVADATSKVLDVGRDAKIQGDFGIVFADGGAAEITNAGAVAGMETGLRVSGSTHIEIVNAATGRISGGEGAIWVSGASADIVNHGSIVATSGRFAISGSAFNDTVRNDGRIVGKIALGDGDDRFDARGGKVSGDILGGSGNDTLITDKASDILVESAGGGTDTVQSTVAYALTDNVENLVLLGKVAINGTGNALDNEVHGNAGANELIGLAGDDALWGGKGNDRLSGGDGADSFHFSTGDGNDRVMDFDAATDALHLEGWTAFADLDDLKANFATDSGDDLVIKVGKDSLTILGVHKADLDATNVFL